MGVNQLCAKPARHRDGLPNIGCEEHRERRAASPRLPYLVSHGTTVGKRLQPGWRIAEPFHQYAFKQLPRCQPGSGRRDHLDVDPDIAQGNLMVQIESTGHDEIAELAQSFGIMSTGLRQMVTDLQRASSALEGV